MNGIIIDQSSKRESTHSNGLTIDGNNISGDTYPVRSYITSKWGGRWDKENKCWTVDESKINDYFANQTIMTNNRFKYIPA